MPIEDNLSLFSYSLYIIAYGTSIIALLMTSLTRLRVIFVISSLCYAVYYYIFPAEPLWLDVLSEGGFVVINLFMLLYVYWKTRQTNFNEQEDHLFSTQFEMLSPYEFGKLVKIAKWEICEPGEILIEHHQSVGRIYCLFSGEVEVNIPNTTPLIRKSGGIIGELSYLLNRTAQGKVIVTDRSVLVSWDQKELQSLCSSSDSIGNAINSLISKQMAEKLSDQG